MNETETISHAATTAIVNCVLNPPLMVTSVIGNSLVLAAINRTPSIRSPSMIMLYSLAVSDLLVGVIVQPLFIAREFTKNILLFHVSEVLGFLFCVVSLWTMTAIGVDRYIALHYHMRYSSIVTKSRVRYTMVMIWAICSLLSCFHFWSEPAFYIMLAAVTGICISISKTCYIRIYLIVRQHDSELHAQQMAVEISRARTTRNVLMMRLAKSALNTFMFHIVLLLCYFPTYLLSTLNGISPKGWITELNFAMIAVFLKSSINPFLFCWRLQELRAAVLKTTKEVFCQQTRRKTDSCPTAGCLLFGKF